MLDMPSLVLQSHCGAEGQEPHHIMREACVKLDSLQLITCTQVALLRHAKSSVLLLVIAARERCCHKLCKPQ